MKIKRYVKGMIVLDINSKKYKFVSDEKNFLMSCGTGIAIEIKDWVR